MDFYDIPPGALPAADPAKSFSSPGSALIAAWEQAGGDVKALRRVYNPLPHWPGRKSGLTIGMGYDLNHQNDQLLKKEWGKVLSPEDLAKLSDYTPSINAKGKQVPKKKNPSKAALVATKDVVIKYDDAVKVYEDKILPRYQAMANKAFPGFVSLDPYTQGALLSMVYNRKQAKALRKKHFMEIREAVMKHDTKAIEAVLRAMKSEHNDPETKKGLYRRRDAEADLIKDHQTEIDKFYKTAPMWDPNFYI
jgi:GH24 family phage-related lysozyme (muramidase)